MKKVLILITFNFLLADYFCCAQNKIDSLLALIKKDKEDTNKVNHLNNACKEYIKTNECHNGFLYGKQALKLAQSLDFKKGIAASYNNIGIIYWQQSNYPETLKNYFSALKIREEIKDKQGMGNSYINIGLVYKHQFIYTKALE